ncbi:type II 3-dehydroquinate dehydratase [Paraburkholderia acidisoli]|uniref:3-dehydroquinate dehydratase n=1 Tax=Paraburkholderia acidisoli TaxID=2571748 RepID=A0A7Z2GRD0_9BURK|nr:type II 3-dehydroquinate dehydratase [Paraburkholderia acidisoli]QGZ66477.1 type II 3-dehydroquinate dehydratase [Paraburkholderia acidisoli]
MQLPSVLVLNGPNLNLLGTREPAIYGAETLSDVEQMCRDAAARLNLRVDCRQSNAEHQLIDWIHECRTQFDGIVINPGAYTHTSVAIADAIVGVAKPVIEVHISNVHKREAFRHHSYISPIAEAILVGCGTQGYVLALERMATVLAKKVAK